MKENSTGGYTGEMPVLRVRLWEVARRAVDESLAGCSVDDFCDGFSVEPQQLPVLKHIYKQVQSKLRENSLVC